MSEPSGRGAVASTASDVPAGPFGRRDGCAPGEAKWVGGRVGAGLGEFCRT